MSYRYAEHRAEIFTERGQVMFLNIRDNVKQLLRQAGAFRMQEAWRDVSGDAWLMLACVDRLVELGEIREISQANCMGQYRVFVEA